jgi:hypothetical protein
MQTMGENKAAIEKYIQALHVYEDVLGQRHLYCAAVLSNLGNPIDFQSTYACNGINAYRIDHWKGRCIE